MVLELTRLELILRRVAANENPRVYLAQVKEFARSVATARNFNFYLNGNPVGNTTFSNTVKAGLTVRSIDMKVAGTSGEEGEDTSLDTTVTFTYTPNGFRFNEPVPIQGLTIQNFIWNEQERKYTCTDPGVSIEWFCTDPPPQFNYNAFIGDFTLKYGGAALTTSATTYSTLNVTITAEVEDQSYTIKGLLSSANDLLYTTRLKYDASAGLIFDAQKLGNSGANEIWAAIAFWNGTGTVVRAVSSYSSLKSANFVKSTSGNQYGTGYSFTLSDNSKAGFPSQPGYFSYGITFRTYAPGTTGSGNGTQLNIGAFSDQYRGYNISLTKK